MTGRRTDHRTAAKALQLNCPKCRATPGIRCCSMSGGPQFRRKGHCRLHVERLTVARNLIRKAYAA